MSKLRIEFSLNRHTSVPAPHVRIWLDTNGTGILENEEEVSLEPKGLSWIGAIDTEKSTSGMLILARYLASPGAELRLRVVSDTPTSHDVFDVTRVIKRVQGFLVGVLAP